MSEVAYVLKGYPRLSETFITSEIFRVEQAGQSVRLFVIKALEDHQRASHYPVVERIKARPVYLPAATPLTGTPLRRWLPRNLPAFAPALRRVARRRPAGTARALAVVVAQTARELRDEPLKPRKKHLKEFLQAAALADEVMRCPQIARLHAHFANDTTMVAWLAALMTGLRFSFTAHAHDIYDAALNPAGLLRRKLLAAEFVVTCTEANRRHLHGLAPEATVHRVYHGLNADVARMVAGAPPHAARNGRLRVLAVGRLVRKKGFDVLVDACFELERRGVPFDALIVGPDGGEGDALRSRIGERGLDGRVTLTGSMDQVALCDEYRRADVLCQPSRVLGNDRDGIPNVLVEGMACGVPVVTTNVSGIPELVTDAVNGLLVPADDPAALAGALQRLAADPGLGERLAQAGAQTVRERFDGTRAAASLVELFAGAAA